MPELRDAKGVDARVDEGVAHEQNHVELEQRAVALAVRVHGARHEEDEVEEKRRPANHKGPKQDGESQDASHAVAPAPQVPMLPAAVGQGSDLPGVDAGKDEHVYIQEVDHHQGDDKEDDKAAHDEVGVEEPHHEHGRNAAGCPDGAQDGARAPRGHDVVVAESVEDGDVPESETKGVRAQNNKNKHVRQTYLSIAIAKKLKMEPKKDMHSRESTTSSTCSSKCPTFLRCPTSANRIITFSQVLVTLATVLKAARLPMKQYMGE